MVHGLEVTKPNPWLGGSRMNFVLEASCSGKDRDTSADMPAILKAKINHACELLRPKAYCGHVQMHVEIWVPSLLNMSESQQMSVMVCVARQSFDADHVPFRLRFTEANSEKTHGNVEGNPQRKYNVVPLQALSLGT